MTLFATKGEVCDCGRSALTLCATGIPGLTLIQCQKPVCKDDGLWCEQHRHKMGTMGYGLVGGEFRFEFEKFVPSDGHIGSWVEAAYLNLLPLRWQLERMFAKNPSIHPPPAPLPKMVVLYEGRRFVQNADGKIVEESR